MKKFSLITCLALTLCLSVFSFSGISFAEENSINPCIKSCDSNKQVCLNMNPDTRLCEAQYQDCVTTCKLKSDTTPSTPLPKSDSSSTTPVKTPKNQTPQ